MKRLKLKCDDPPSKIAFKFNLRRYTLARLAQCAMRAAPPPDPASLAVIDASLNAAARALAAGAYTRPLFDST